MRFCLQFALSLISPLASDNDTYAAFDAPRIFVPRQGSDVHFDLSRSHAKIPIQIPMIFGDFVEVPISESVVQRGHILSDARLGNRTHASTSGLDVATGTLMEIKNTP